MALFTNGNYIKPMLFRVTIVMVIFYSISATSSAIFRASWGKLFGVMNRMGDGVSGLYSIGVPSFVFLPGLTVPVGLDIVGVVFARIFVPAFLAIRTAAIGIFTFAMELCKGFRLSALGARLKGHLNFSRLKLSRIRKWGRPDTGVGLFGTGCDPIPIPAQLYHRGANG